MKKIIDDSRLMIKVCDLYYNENKNQQQIANILNISYPTVSHLLSGAVEQNIVNITISNLDMVKYWDLEQQVKKIFKLRDVVIVDSSAECPDVKQKLGNAASKYLENILTPGAKVGISMGSTLYHMAYSPITKNTENITFIPLVGGMGRLRTELHSNHLAETLAKKYNSRFVPLYAPARVSNKVVRKELKNETGVSEVLALQKGLSVAVVGIGYPNDNSSIKATGYYKDNEIQSLLEKNVAGEICMQFYDISGNTSLYKNDNTVIGINLNMLRKIPYSVAVAGGNDKIPAIIGAINGKYINVLITDYNCAKGLIKYIKKGEEADEL